MGLFKNKKEGQPLQAEKGTVDSSFLVLVLIVLTCGLVMMFSASYAYAYYYFDNSFHFITRQLFFAVLGVFVMMVVSFVDYHVLHRFVVPVMAVTVVLLVVVLFMPEINYVHRWINLGFTTFQPSEFAKFSVVLSFAHLISVNYSRMKTFKYGILPFALILGVFAVLLMLEPHLSATVLICLIGAVMMFVGGSNLKWFALVAAVGVAGLALAAMNEDIIAYATSRFAYWLDPFSDPQGKGYQTLQSLYAIASGGLLGLGIGQSRQKYLYLPEPQNDFVFAVVCEELGFVGAVFIILLFALLIWRGFAIAAKARDRFGSMLAVGLTTQLGLQVILNIAVVTNTIPNTGISMPFFSYGGTALVMLLAQMGVVLSVSRQSSLPKE
ncbi:MAG: putative lipid II flippase FtsW [Oscillospiraceae bacterium]|nr:putative lipid II flippase FtsW [Oscillospiraceae bacterium]